jgi:hypothetical protein
MKGVALKMLPAWIAPRTGVGGTPSYQPGRQSVRYISLAGRPAGAEKMAPRLCVCPPVGDKPGEGVSRATALRGNG